MRQGMSKINCANGLSIVLIEDRMADSKGGNLMLKYEQTDQPISTSYDAGPSTTMFAENEHIQFTLLDNNKDIHPRLILCSLSRRLPVLFATKYAFLCPWSTEEGQFFICNANCSRPRLVAMHATIVIFLCFSYDRVGEIRGKTQSRCQERRACYMHALEKDEPKFKNGNIILIPR
jgi:hypothetical protein